MDAIDRPIEAHAPSAAVILTPNAPGRAAAERYVRDVYQQCYGARLAALPDHLFALTGPSGLNAVAGLRDAAAEKLFLEAYLDQPIERCIAAREGLAVNRNEIVEVSNLAVLGAGDGRRLIKALTLHLHERGFRWVVFTATRVLRNSFRRLGLAPVGLAAADPASLGEARRYWGRYYQAGPEVMYGCIQDGYRRFLSKRAAE